MIGFVLGAAAVVALQLSWRLLNCRRYFGWRVRIRKEIIVGAGDCVAVEVWRPWSLSGQRQQIGVILTGHENFALYLDEHLSQARLRAAVLNAAEGRARRKLPA